MTAVPLTVPVGAGALVSGVVDLLRLVSVTPKPDRPQALEGAIPADGDGRRPRPSATDGGSGRDQVTNCWTGIWRKTLYPEEIC
ncbi:MAG: hypothetical protein U0231_13680 [Nitrospiraceae bacterium]